MAPIPRTTSVQTDLHPYEKFDLIDEITAINEKSRTSNHDNNSSDSCKSLSEFEPIKLTFTRKFHKKSGKMKREELEEILLQKITEAIIYKTKIAEYRSHQERYESAIEKFLNRIVNLEKQYNDLQMAHNDVMQKLREYQALGPQMREIEPIKVVRAVGLQVISTANTEFHKPIVIPDSPEPPHRNRNVSQEAIKDLNNRGQKRRSNDEIDQNISKRQKRNQEIEENEKKKSGKKIKKLNLDTTDIGLNSTLIENEGRISDSCLDDTIISETNKNDKIDADLLLDQSFDTKTPEKKKNKQQLPKVNKSIQNKETFKAPKPAIAKTALKKSTVTTQALLNTSMSSECSFMSDATFSKFDPTVKTRMTSTPVKNSPKSSEIKELKTSLVKENLKIPPLPQRSKQNFPSMNSSLKKPPARPILNVDKQPAGIKLTWNMDFVQKDHSDIKKYEIFSFNHADEYKTENWTKIGEVDPLLLPMAVTLSFDKNIYHFAVRVKDIDDRVGEFSLPKTWN